MSRSSKLLLVLFAIILAVVALMRFFEVYTDFLWFGELDQMDVIKTVWTTRIKLGVAVAVCFFIWLFANMRWARRLLPKDATIIGQRLLPDAERATIEKHIDKILLLFALVGALLAGVTAGGRWVEWLRYANAVPFGTSDPLLGMDVGFYVFKLPFLQYVWRTSFYAVVVAFVVVTLIHLYNESIRIHGKNVQATMPAQIHCVTLLALAFLLKGVGYYLARYTLMYDGSDAVPGGPGYAAAHWRLPIFSWQIGATVIAAGICIATIWIRNLRLPAFALAGVILFALLFGTSLPAVVEHLQVRPNAVTLEMEYIQHNLDATRAAYGLDNVLASQHKVPRGLSQADVDENDLTIQNLRIWDDRPLQYLYRQQQALRQYYEFASVDLDRYQVDGKIRQVSIAARQLDYDRVGDAWPNKHLQYTHGYGLCMSPVNQVTSEGYPDYWIGDFPPKLSGEAADQEHLEVDVPGLYYMENVLWDAYGYGQRPEPPASGGDGPGGPGEDGAAEQPAPEHERRQARRDVSPFQSPSLQDDYVIVKSGTSEIDYPSGPEAGDTVKTTYSGAGGVPIKGLFKKIAFWVRFGIFQEYPLLFYKLGNEARIIYNRWVPDRIMELAPGLLFADTQPYPVVHEGRVVWIIDSYTVAYRYPYSTALGPQGRAPNYIRNSVKATVDAYDGTTKLYVWDPSDPLIQCYRKMFPTLFLDKEQMPADLEKHVRYPAFLFEVQTGMYARYHVEDPLTFFEGEDFWAIPKETFIGDERTVEPYYVLMSLPDSVGPEFMLIRPYTPIHREKLNMVSWMCARCDGDNYGELRLYTFDKQALQKGPMQIEAQIDQHDELADYFRLKSQTNRIIRGHLLVIPFGESLMYVEPIYLESKQNAIPKLDMVVVATSTGLAYGKTLPAALRALFTGRSTLVIEPEDGDGDPTEPVVEGPTTPSLSGSVAELAAEMEALWAEAELARQSGDMATWVAKLDELGPMIDKLQELSAAEE